MSIVSSHITVVSTEKCLWKGNIYAHLCQTSGIEYHELCDEGLSTAIGYRCQNMRYTRFNMLLTENSKCMPSRLAMQLDKRYMQAFRYEFSEWGTLLTQCRRIGRVHAAKGRDVGPPHRNWLVWCRSSNSFQSAALHTSYANCGRLQFGHWPTRYVSNYINISSSKNWADR